MRHPDWPRRLSEYIEAARFTPFEWGTHDCCVFCDDAVMAMTGESRMAALRGAYASARAAAGLIKRAGGLVAITSRHLGQPAFGNARRGDVVMFESLGHGPALGICIGAQFAAAGPDGVAFGDISAAQAVWRID